MNGPDFVDNRNGNTFGKAVKGHLEALRNAGETPEELCIATGYFNAAGWRQIADEVERLPKVRLLIGAEPNPPRRWAPANPRPPGTPEKLPADPDHIGEAGKGLEEGA